MIFNVGHNNYAVWQALFSKRKKKQKKTENQLILMKYK